MELRPANELSALRPVSIGIDGEPLPTFEKGRVCAHPSCATQLSVYNPSPTCWQHEQAKPFILRVRNGVASSTAA
jgi:hypothetical protein